MTKNYRVLKSNFLWSKGAILVNSCGSYRAVSDVWDVNEYNSQGITSEIVEKNEDYFERVYEINTADKVEYKSKEDAQEIMSKQKTEGPAKTEDTSSEDEEY